VFALESAREFRDFDGPEGEVQVPAKIAKRQRAQRAQRKSNTKIEIKNQNAR
jgi:hypothetical protein